MPNDFFQFRQFTIRQARCAMKVGTDGTLLGAWARGGKHILDVGTGTGLIALMMAQRFHEAHITGIDIAPEAVSQAKENVAASPFANRIDILEADFSLLSNLNSQILNLKSQIFDCIVSNPPYFEQSLECPDPNRTQARHTSSLSYATLMKQATSLLTEDGVFSIIIPAESKSRMESEAALCGLFKTRECAVKTTPRKPARRYLLEFSKHPTPSFSPETGIIETAPGIRSSWYQALTKDFYL